MNPALIALTYAGLGLGAHAAWKRAWRVGALAPSLRGAWSAAWLAATVTLVATGALDWPRALAVAAWTFALAASRGPASRGPAARWGLAGVVAVAAEAAWGAGAPSAGGALAAVALGAAVASTMERRTRLGPRLAAHWLSFAGTFAVLLPVGIAQAFPAHVWSGPRPGAGLAALLGACGVALAGWATCAFHRAGGTPEPLDAPPRLVRDGPYVFVRHPIQAAEVLLVWAGACLVPGPPAFAYAAGFTIALVGPVRWYEERRLRARFGAEVDAWRISQSGRGVGRESGEASTSGRFRRRA